MRLRLNDEFFFLLIIQIALVVMTGIDFIVHGTLYGYGLQFSYSWAYPYWILLSVMFLVFGLLAISGYLIDRKNIVWKKVILIFITIQVEYYGGLLDTIFFIIARVISGNPLNWFMVWWWSPYYSWFGINWNLRYNVILNIVAIVAIVITWFMVLRVTKNAKKNKTKKTN